MVFHCLLICSSILSGLISYNRTSSICIPFANFYLLSPFTPSQPYCLTVFLELGDELIALLNHIVVLLVLIVRSVSLNDSLPSHAVDGAGNTFSCNEFGKITAID